MHVTLFGIALFLGIVHAKVSTALARGGVEEKGITAVVGVFTVIATFATFVLGFFLYSWWIPIAAFIGLSVLVAFVVTRQTFAVLELLNLPIGIAVVAFAIFGWWRYASG